MFLSETVKGLRFISPSKLTSQRVLAEDMRPLGQRQMTLLFTAMAVGRLSAFALVHWLPVPTGWWAEGRWHLYTWWFTVQERNSDLRELDSFITGSEHACLSPQRKTLFLSYWTKTFSLPWSATPSLYCKAICYVNTIFEKTVQNPGRQCLCWCNVQQCTRRGDVSLSSFREHLSRCSSEA